MFSTILRSVHNFTLYIFRNDSLACIPWLLVVDVIVFNATENKRNYDVSCFYNSEEDEEEAVGDDVPNGKDLDALTQSVLKSRRKQGKLDPTT